MRELVGVVRNTAPNQKPCNEEIEREEERENKTRRSKDLARAEAWKRMTIVPTTGL